MSIITLFWAGNPPLPILILGTPTHTSADIPGDATMFTYEPIILNNVALIWKVGIFHQNNSGIG